MAPTPAGAVVQLAADGRWEDAETVPLAAASARPLAERAMRAARDDVAVEVMWPGKGFFGARWPVDGWRAGAAAVCRVAAEPDLPTLLGAAPARTVEFAELGAVNNWRPTGPERLWPRGENLGAVLARRADLVRCAHPVAVEFAVSDPQPCWVGVWVSVRRGRVHHLDVPALHDVLTRVCGAR